MLCSGAAGIAVAEVNDCGDLDAVKAAVEGLRAVGKNLLVIAGHRRLVDLEASGEAVAE